MNKAKKNKLTTAIKKEIKKDIASNHKISKNQVFNFLKEYKALMGNKKINLEHRETEKINANLAILYTRLKIIGKHEKYSKMCLEELEIINNFFIKKEEMLSSTKSFLLEIESIPKENLGFDLNLLKNITVQTVFKLNTDFNKNFKELIKRSQKATEPKEFYTVLSKANKRLDDIFVKNKYVN